MSAPVLVPPVEVDRLERLEAELLRSPSATWPRAYTPGAVELPVRDAAEHADGPVAWWTQYRTRGVCCR